MRAAALFSVVQNTTHTHTTPSSNSKPTPLPIHSRPARQPPPSYRKPLQSRDQNAMMRVVPQKTSGSAPLTIKSGNPNMPSYDKQNQIQPPPPPRRTLTAAAKTGNNKPPVTPKLSARPNSRQTRSENTTPLNNTRETITPPVSTFLKSGNVTGRTSTRKIRFDSSSNTPSSSSNTSDPPPRLYHDSTQNGAGLGITGLEKDTSKRHSASHTSASSSSDYNHVSSAQSPADSKFFFASEVKPEIHAPQQTKPLPPKRSSTFFYANGDKIAKEAPLRPVGGSTVGSTIGEDRGHAKFFRANGTPELQLSPSPHFPPTRPSSVASNHSRVTSPRIANNITSPSQRPGSPQKTIPQYASKASARGVPSLPSPGLPRPQLNGRQQSGNNGTQGRRTSGDFGPGHRRSISGGSSMEKALLTRKISSGGYSNDGQTPITLTEPSSPASILATEDIPEEEDDDEFSDEDDDASSVGSEEEHPEVIKAGGSIERMNELAANARRERIVLDLELRNSSLAAVNRTLEREMRKQTAELRRYKRLSRSGRFLTPMNGSSRVTSTTLSVDGADTDVVSLSAMSEENSDAEFDEDEDEDEEFDTEEDDLDEGALSPGAVAQNDLKHRKKDEERLQLDLAKHQQLLVDSQRMNQSLKRCLGWTEELINEGKKALEYRVKLSDVPLAPRVLAPLDDGEEGDNEGMSEIGASILREARKAAQEHHKTHLAVPIEADFEDDGNISDGPR